MSILQRKAESDHVKKAYEELINELKHEIQERKKSYEALEVKRVKCQMRKDLDFLITDDIRVVDENWSKKIFDEEEELKVEIKELEDKLKKCESEMKPHWFEHWIKK